MCRSSKSGYLGEEANHSGTGWSKSRSKSVGTGSVLAQATFCNALLQNECKYHFLIFYQATSTGKAQQRERRNDNGSQLAEWCFLHWVGIAQSRRQQEHASGQKVILVVTLSMQFQDVWHSPFIPPGNSV
jgi:hypothetical protein